jgi:hypothetical protein
LGPADVPYLEQTALWNSFNSGTGMAFHPPNLGATPGSKRVEIRASRPVGPIDPVMNAPGDYEEYVPRRYNKDSTLTAEVTTSGANTFDFALTK